MHLPNAGNEGAPAWLSSMIFGQPTSTALRFCRGAGILFAATHVLAKWRLLPDPILKLIFAANLCASMTVSNLLIAAIQALRAMRIIPRSVAPGLCSVVTVLCCRWSRFASPHVPVHILPGSLPSFVAMDTPNAVLLNHASFMDTVLFMWIVNPIYMLTMKTFYKVQLEKLPLLGTVLLSSEMLPVYFVSDHNAEFRVDKEKQALVAERTERHLAAGGSVSFYPEGALNTTDVRELKPFRTGSFKILLEHRLHLYYMLHIGTPSVWRAKEFIGGHAGTIYVYFGNIDVDYDTPGLDAEKLAELCRNQMQARLDAMHAQIASGNV
jgi:1-acyl-sn-glycerol-3-phosphate acyltransferase